MSDKENGSSGRSNEAHNRAGGSEQAKKWLWEQALKVADADTPDRAALFLSKMIYVCVAQILGLRDLLPREAFAKKTLDNGQHYYRFNKEHERGLELYNLMRCMHDCVEKKYLRAFTLVIGAPDAVHESYRMNIAYDDGHVFALSYDTTPLGEIGYRGAQTFQQEAGFVIENLVCLLSSLEPLPKDIPVGYQISYFENTPRDFMFNGRLAMKRSREPLRYVRDEQQLKVGRVRTCDSALVVDMRSCYVPADYKKRYADARNRYNAVLERRVERRAAEKRPASEAGAAEAVAPDPWHYSRSKRSKSSAATGPIQDTLSGNYGGSHEQEKNSGQKVPSPPRIVRELKGTHHEDDYSEEEPTAKAMRLAAQSTFVAGNYHRPKGRDSLDSITNIRFEPLVTSTPMTGKKGVPKRVVLRSAVCDAGDPDADDSDA